MLMTEKRRPQKRRPVNGSNIYRFEMSNPVIGLDPMGLADQPATQPATTQPIPGPTVGPVTTTTGPDTRFQLYIHAHGKVDVYQTIQIKPDPNCKIPLAATTQESSEHGGNDPTTRPVGDNGTGDPNKPVGGGVHRLPGVVIFTDRPNFDDPKYPNGFKGSKFGHIKVVCNGQTIAEFDFVSTAVARGPGSTTLTPSPPATTQSVKGPTTRPAQ